MTDNDLREAARKRLEQKAAFRTFLFVWVMVSAIVTAVWYFTSPQGYFWPMYPIGGMGIAAAFFAWAIYGAGPGITEADVNAEISRMTKKP